LDDVQILEESLTIKGEEPLSTVQENAVLDETQDSSRTRSGRTFRQPVPEAVQARPSQSPSPSVAPENRPNAQTGTLDVQMTEVQAKAYVADQVRRWERDTSERKVPPEVKYDWPQVRLNPTSYISAVLTTSEYLRQRLSMATQADAWVFEMQLRRRTFGTARDLTAALIPPGMFSPRECATVLQTLLFGRVPARPPQSSIPSPSSLQSVRQQWLGIWKLHCQDPACRSSRDRQVCLDRAQRQACFACLKVRMNL
jgi:hypothetical protein